MSKNGREGPRRQPGVGVFAPRYQVILRVSVSFSIIAALAGGYPVLGQQQKSSLHLWKLQQYSGSVILGADLRSLDWGLSNNYHEHQDASIFSADVNLRTQSSVLHPNFLTINTDLRYSPTTTRDLFLVTPDRTETATAEYGDASMSFFNALAVRSVIFGNYTHAFMNREFSTDVESYQSAFGANLSYAFAPHMLNLSVRREELIQNELASEQSLRTTGMHYTLEGNTRFMKACV